MDERSELIDQTAADERCGEERPINIHVPIDLRLQPGDLVARVAAHQLAVPVDA